MQEENKLTERAACNLGIKSLFHYRRFNADHFAALVKDGTVRYSNPANFNDPWECRPQYSLSVLNSADGRERAIKWMQSAVVAEAKRLGTPVPKKETQEQQANELRRNHAFLRSLVEQCTDGIAAGLRADYRVFCLATKPDDALMWSYYGDHHRGVCLQFGTKGVFVDAYKVNYSATYPERDIADEDDYASVVDSFLTKAEVWAHEGEFRSLNQEGEIEGHPACTDGFVKTAPEDLEAVIMGCQVSDESRAIIERTIEGAGRRIELFQARLVPGHYRLAIEKL